MAAGQVSQPGCPGDAVQIVLSDTGVGIPPENIGKIFDPFFTSKDVGQGTGLGLAITHGIIEAHGGSITVDSIPGEGATFTITMPLDNTDNLFVRMMQRGQCETRDDPGG